MASFVEQTFNNGGIKPESAEASNKAAQSDLKASMNFPSDDTDLDAVVRGLGARVAELERENKALVDERDMRKDANIPVALEMLESGVRALKHAKEVALKGNRELQNDIDECIAGIATHHITSPTVFCDVTETTTKEMVSELFDKYRQDAIHALNSGIIRLYQYGVQSALETLDDDEYVIESTMEAFEEAFEEHPLAVSRKEQQRLREDAEYAHLCWTRSREIAEPILMGAFSALLSAKVAQTTLVGVQVDGTRLGLALEEKQLAEIEDVKVRGRKAADDVEKILRGTLRF